MFHMCFRRLLRKLYTKNVGSPVVQKRTKVVSLRRHNSLESGDILTGIQTCIHKRMDSRFLQKDSENSKQFLSWLRFIKKGKIEQNLHAFFLSSSLIRHLIGP